MQAFRCCLCSDVALWRAQHFIYLNLLDQVWHKRGYPEKLGATLHRYADDAILICRKSGAHALQAFEAIASRMGLTINREKTRITKLIEGFDFIASSGSSS